MTIEQPMCPPRRPSDASHAKSFRDLEGDICDLSLMAELAADRIESILDSFSEADPDQRGYERGTFAILHLRRMIDALKAKYYAEWQAARGETV